MKPWLFDILACPIDKFFPLKLFIFSFENAPEEFQLLINIYKNRDLNFIKNEEVIKVYQENGEFLLKDNIVIENNKLETYLKLIISSIDELEHIFDKTTNTLSKQCFRTIKTDVKTKILDFLKNINLDQFEKILPELYLINKFKLEFEIKSGILLCNKCKRWYPIIETIPQMLPDNYRDEIKEINFLKTNKNLLNEEFFNQDLKPFNI